MCKYSTISTRARGGFLVAVVVGSRGSRSGAASRNRFKAKEEDNVRRDFIETPKNAATYASVNFPCGREDLGGL